MSKLLIITFQEAGNIESLILKYAKTHIPGCQLKCPKTDHKQTFKHYNKWKYNILKRKRLRIVYTPSLPHWHPLQPACSKTELKTVCISKAVCYITQEDSVEENLICSPLGCCLDSGHTL